MKVNLFYVAFLFLLFSCSDKKENNTQPPPLFSQPKTVEANPEGGYFINVITGDSIKPLTNSVGDTIKTGVPIPIKGKVIDRDSISKPKSFPIPSEDKLIKINAQYNLHKVPKNLTIIPINEDSLNILPIARLKKGDKNHFILNSVGDTIPTFVTIPAKGKLVKVNHPKLVKALPLRIKDAARSNIQYLDVDQGLNSTHVESILEDKRGNLWFATYGRGVSKYDGNFITNFTKEEGLHSNYVSSIFEDRNGNIWFGSYNEGVSKYDGLSFTYFNEMEGLTNNEIRAIVEDASGNLWFGTYSGGISKYDGKYFTHFTENEGLCSNNISSILLDKSGNLWFGTFEGQLIQFDGESFIKFPKIEGLYNNIILCSEEDSAGNLWFGTFEGVFKYDGKSFTHYTVKDGLSNNVVQSIEEDNYGNIWLGTRGGGLCKFDGESIIHFTKNEGLVDNIVYSIIEDKAGNLWFGVEEGGVSRFNIQSFKHYTKHEGLVKSNTSSIIEDNKGNLWFGSFGGGVSMYDGEYFTHFTELENLSNNYVMSILEDKIGNLWFGTYEGVCKYDGESFIHISEKEGLSGSGIYSMIEDHKGNLWFGSFGKGVSKYDGKYFTHYTEKEGLSTNNVNTIIEDKSGNLWFGTIGGGVCKYDGENFTHYTEREGLSSNYIYSIIEDKNGILWFGTYGGGVCKYDGESFTHYTEKEGLSDDYIHSILEDKSGNLWFSAETGLNQLEMIEKKGETIPNLSARAKSKERKSDVYSIKRFNRKDGLRGKWFNSLYLDSKDRIWFGSDRMLSMLDLNTYKSSQYSPQVYLRDVIINDEFASFHSIEDSLKKELNFIDVQPFENYPLSLNASHNQNHLTFHYSAIDWNAPHKIQYSSRLLGQNDKWSIPSTETKVDFRDLDFGKYILQIRAIGESGEWSKPFEYEFKIAPPWWHTWWARTTFGLIIIISILGFISWRTAKLKERQKELETEVENATLKIRQQKGIVEDAHREITDSIQYAERIQRSFLASKELLDENLKDYFVFFQPKEAVSGDFYWAGKLKNGNFAIVNADSTGHGVPGAIMSILNISSIEKAVEKGYCYPADIFNDTRATVIDRLKNDGSEEGGKDGMDASIISFDFENNKFKYTAAQNPIWVIREGKLTVIAPEKMPIGKHDKDHIPFVGGEFEMQKGDQIYTLTDGFQDQFGGPKGKKFMIKKMREYILSISHLPMKKQDQKLKEAFTIWKGEEEQVDDVCVLGVRV